MVFIMIFTDEGDIQFRSYKDFKLGEKAFRRAVDTAYWTDEDTLTI